MLRVSAKKNKKNQNKTKQKNRLFYLFWMHFLDIPLKLGNICFATIPNNITRFFQPLDLTVNGHRKTYIKNKYAEWYLQQLDNAVQAGTEAVIRRCSLKKVLLKI